MASRERPADRGNRLGRESLARLGREIREARVDRGLSLAQVGRQVGVSAAQASRVERGLSPSASVLTLSRYAAVVGLDLVARCYAGPTALRDQAHASLLDDLATVLHPSLRMPREVPLPSRGDQRSWDGLILGHGWRFGVEAETAPHDAQALARRLALKERDGSVDGVLLVLRDTYRTRSFLAAAVGELRVQFSTPARRALARLRSGERPEGNAIIVLHHRRAHAKTPTARSIARARPPSDAGRTVAPHATTDGWADHDPPRKRPIGPSTDGRCTQRNQ